jgi:hypothetical protein
MRKPRDGKRERETRMPYTPPKMVEYGTLVSLTGDLG